MSKPILDPAIAAIKYDHGSRARYTLGRCRCAPCRAATCAYEKSRHAGERKIWRLWRVRMTGGFVVKNVKTGAIALRTFDRDDAVRRRDELNGPIPKRSSELISARPARTHIAALRRAGMGRRVIGRHARINDSVLVRIISGEIKKTRRSTADRILAIRLETTAPPGGARVRADKTRELLAEILATGIPKARVARALGAKARFPALQVALRATVTIATARRVRALHGQLCPPPVVEPTPQERLKARLSAMDADEFSVRLSRLRDLGAAG